MATFLWGTIGTVVSALTTELNAITNGTGTAYGPEISNVTGWQLGTLWLHLGSSSLAFTAASYCSIYLVPSTTPGTASGVYPKYTSGSSYKLAVANYWVGDIFINPATQSANVVDETLPNVVLPSGYFKAILVNNTGVTLPATLNTLSYYGTPTQVA